MPVREPLTFVFFDVGATLVEPAVTPEAVALAALERAVAGAREPALLEALRAMGDVYETGVDACRTLADEDAFWRRCAAAGLGVLHRSPAESDVAAVAEALGEYRRNFRVRPGMRELLGDVRGAGLGLGIISNWPPSLAGFLDHHGLGPFDVLACSGVLGVTKPDPAIFRWALSAAGVPAARAAHVGDDHERDIVPARALGMRAVWAGPTTTADDVRRALGLRVAR